MSEATTSAAPLDAASPALPLITDRERIYFSAADTAEEIEDLRAEVAELRDLVAQTRAVNQEGGRS